MLSCRPAPALHRLIRYYYQVETQLADRTEIQPVPARSPQAIEFTFGAPYEVRCLDRRAARSAYPIALIGSQTYRMHMVRDFNRLSGECPTAICSQLDMFVRPELLSANVSRDRQ